MLYNKFLPRYIIGIDVFLERFQTRKFVGSLTKKSNKFCFSYDLSYLKEKNVLPLGPDFPMTQKEFISTSLFPTFKDRLPNHESASYAEHCTNALICVTTKDPLVLLGTVGKKGPSSFVFEPVYKQISYKECENIRKELNLSLSDFARLFGISPSILQKIKSGESSGKEVLEILERAFQRPENLEFQLKDNSKWLHSNKILKVQEWINERKKESFDMLGLDEAMGTQLCLEKISTQKWSGSLISEVNKFGISCEAKDLFFEVRCAAAFLLKRLNIAYAYNAGVGKTDVDFRVKGHVEYLIECVRLGLADFVKKATWIEEEISKTILQSPTYISRENESEYGENQQSTEWACIQVQKKINTKVANSKGIPIKFPEPSESQIHMILINMNNFIISGGDTKDYKQIAFGASEVGQEDRVYWHQKPLKGIFDSDDYKFIRERIHLIGFVREWKNEGDEDLRLERIDCDPGKVLDHTIFMANPHIFNSEQKEKELGAKLQKDFGPVKVVFKTKRSDSLM